MTAMLLLPAVCFAVRALRLFVAESLHRNIGRLKDAESGRPAVWDGIPKCNEGISEAYCGATADAIRRWGLRCTTLRLPQKAN